MVSRYKIYTVTWAIKQKINENTNRLWFIPQLTKQLNYLPYYNCLISYLYPAVVVRDSKIVIFGRLREKVLGYFFFGGGKMFQMHKNNQHAVNERSVPCKNISSCMFCTRVLKLFLLSRSLWESNYWKLCASLPRLNIVSFSVRMIKNEHYTIRKEKTWWLFIVLVTYFSRKVATRFNTPISAFVIQCTNGWCRYPVQINGISNGCSSHE